MDYYITIWTVIVFVENRLQTGFEYAELEKATGFSLSYLRAVFAKLTGQSLSRYVLNRKIANAAFEIAHSGQSILSIAAKYGFSNPDSFTRAFRRVTGLNPNEFRKRKKTVGHIKLCAGVYGVSVKSENGEACKKIPKREVYMNNDQEQKHVNKESAVLYGVPKVHYGAFGGCTPFPVCLKAVANYMGMTLDYEDAIVQCGAAFRLVWDTTAWNGGNVDVLWAFDEPMTVYRKGIEALGCEFKLLERAGTVKTPEDDRRMKDDFISFIKENINKGVPVIALGIIGPPEACVITGYRDGGNTLLGWNCFQDSPEYTSSVTVDESGYFITSSWWENRDTVAVMAIGESTGERKPLKSIIETAMEALNGRQAGKFAKGINAYDAWKKAILDDSQFSKDMVRSRMAERLMCQGDAVDCLSDGRGNAHKYFKKLADKNPEQPLLRQIAEQFAASADCAQKMYKALGGWERGEKPLQALARREVREEIGRLIDESRAADVRALELMRELFEIL